jgi:RES domain-containing protein
MILWRISIFSDLIGIGGELGKGRWHTPAEGKRIVYLAEHPALALLETLVNLKERPEDGAEQFQLLRIDIAEGIDIERVAEYSLPASWRENPKITQDLGNGWLERNGSALLAVPSAPSPESTNYLFNPLHPDAPKVSVSWSRWIRYDRRLFRISE